MLNNNQIRQYSNHQQTSKDIKSIEINLNPKNIQTSINLVNDSFGHFFLDNTFTTFNSINNILYLIYTNAINSLISFDISNYKKVAEIKEAHHKKISNIRHYLDRKNKRDLILSISSSWDEDIKIWDINNWECLLILHEVYTRGYLRSAYFLEEKDNIFIIASNDNFGHSEPIKIYDFNRIKIKEINDSNKSTFFIISYYDEKLSNNYIITGNDGYVTSYEYTKNKIYYIYKDNIKSNKCHSSLIIYQNDEIIKLIESSEDGKIRIWDFHSGILLKKIKVSKNELFGLCLWNNDYIFVGSDNGNIILIELKTGNIIKKLKGHYNYVLTIQKIKHPKYGECLVSQSTLNNQIKLWIN